MSEFKILSTLYSSSFSTVYKVKENSSKKNYAIKKTILSSISNLEKWKKRLGLLQILNHAYFFEAINILPIIQYNIKKLDNMSYAIYELMPLAETDLDKKISKSKNSLTQIQLFKILKQLINALCYLQEQGIAHRDIKPGNIFEINGEYYIGDFDQSIKINTNNNNSFDIEEEIKGTEAFLSPILYEALIKNKKSVKHNIFKSDVYSLGLFFVFALTKNVFILQKIKWIKSKDKVKLLILQNLFEKKLEINNIFLEIISKMITLDEKFRPDFIELNNLIKESKL
jgi:serine/threonine protein kinase